jgi:hypothetical protein
MANLDFFFDEARRVFHFLEREHGFDPPLTGTEVRGYTGWLIYRNPTTEVTVQYEIGSAPWVTIAPVKTQGEKRASTTPVSLELMIREAGKPEEVIARPPSQMSEEVLGVMLQEKANWLRRLAKDFLVGRFDTFPALQRKSR